VTPLSSACRLSLFRNNTQLSALGLGHAPRFPEKVSDSERFLCAKIDTGCIDFSSARDSPCDSAHPDRPAEARNMAGTRPYFFRSANLRTNQIVTLRTQPGCVVSIFLKDLPRGKTPFVTDVSTGFAANRLIASWKASAETLQPRSWRGKKVLSCHSAMVQASHKQSKKTRRSLSSAFRGHPILCSLRCPQNL